MHSSKACKLTEGKRKKKGERKEGGEKKRHNVTNKNEDHPKAEPNENQMLSASLANLSPDRRTTCNRLSDRLCETEGIKWELLLCASSPHQPAPLLLLQKTAHGSLRFPATHRERQTHPLEHPQPLPQPGTAESWRFLHVSPE